MSHTGTIKRCMEAFGFVECAEVTAKYGRDAFLHKNRCTPGVFEALQAGMQVSFDISEAPDGRPQVENVQMAGGGAIAPAAPQPQYGAPQGYGGAAGKVTLPGGCTQVSLFGQQGFFVPMELVNMGTPQYAAPQYGAQQGYAPQYGAPQQRSTPYQQPQQQRAPPEFCENPGLADGEEVYYGTMKTTLSNGGFCFVSCDAVKEKFGREAFVHVKRCPWTHFMELKVGEAVAFQMTQGEKGDYLVSRIIKT
jgi:cold shock CspA family protein